MARWMTPDECDPVCAIGERLVMIVRERDLNKLREPMVDRIVLLTRTVNGWESEGGYTVPDAILWTYESDLVKIVDALFPNLMGGSRS